ncbi:hypothetical protein GCM10025771_07580 [Niveibacterium umoris]|uniref:DUF2946 domain-containing protein n=1 Tax=Niveibacterium umoris TaxID=1193620 RepID=A0A840BKA5_9RHOO|nr:hypothetical protein [Niveibacterium umoris]MBB4013695.1 hypothetical protein [Niveibacterium umoris]
MAACVNLGFRALLDGPTALIAVTRRRFVPAALLLWFLLLLPLMQLGALAHGYGHTAQALQSQSAVDLPGYPDVSPCEACLAFSGVTSGVAGESAPTATLTPAFDFTPLSALPAFRAPARLPYASRAPPARIA